VSVQADLASPVAAFSAKKAAARRGAAPYHPACDAAIATTEWMNEIPE